MKRKSSTIQSLLFEKTYFDKSEAERWARNHGFRTTKVDVTANYYRFRQQPPSRVEVIGTKQLTEGIKAVIAR